MTRRQGKRILRCRTMDHSTPRQQFRRMESRKLLAGNIL